MNDTMPTRMRSDRHTSAPRRSWIGVAVILCWGLVVAALTSATWSPGDGESRAQGGAQPVQIASAPAAQAQPSPAPTAAAPASTLRPQAPASADAPMPAGSAGQRVSIDPVTRRIREAEHDDAATGPQAAVQRRTLRTAGALAEPEPVYGPEGMVGMAVPEELNTFVVATRTPDGRIVLEHATGPKAAQAKTRAAKAGTTERKGEPNDR